MKNLQIDIKIKLQINDTTLELSKDEAETLYNALGHALNKQTLNHYPLNPYPWITNPVPYKITEGTGEFPYYPTGVRSTDPTCTIS